jgi:hypothetical protein
MIDSFTRSLAPGVSGTITRAQRGYDRIMDIFSKIHACVDYYFITAPRE